MIFATLMLAVGVAIDFSDLTRSHRQARYAADTAILAAVKKVEDSILAGAEAEDAITEAKQIAKDVFAKNMGRVEYSLDEESFNLTLTHDPSEGTNGRLAYNGSMSLKMGMFTGKKHAEYNFDAEAHYARGLVNYIDLHIVVDTSASMGLPATEADQVRLGELKGCSFACHAEIAEWRDDHGITFRVDIVRDAVLQIIDIFENKGYTGDRMSLSIYTFGSYLAPGVIHSTDLSVSRDYVNTIDLTPNEYTDTQNVMYQLTARIPNSGEGTSVTDRKVIVAMFTDGLSHYAASTTPRIGPLKVFNPYDCNGIKDMRKATMFVFNVEYNVNLIGFDCPDGHEYCPMEEVLIPSIAPNLAQCASAPNYSLPAETPEQIAASIDVFSELIEEQALAISK